MPYKGKTKAEARAMVLAHNKKGGPKEAKSWNRELSLWRLQNRDLTTKKTTEKKEVTPTTEKKGSSNYGQGKSVNKDLARNETYSDYAAEIRGEAPVDNLYKEAPTQKRGFIMKRNRK